jgi:DeoR/GlpR family transcriptional regulator of sugar metabolism
LTDVFRRANVHGGLCHFSSLDVMLAETRRKRLLDLIRRRGFAPLDELVKALGVSESTIRRDLDVLDQAGSVKRTHGGAVCPGEVRSMPALDDRTTSQAVEKRAIGRAAAALVADEETVLLDGGTTTLEVARALLGRPVQVVTNSLPIAVLLAASKETDLILVGGYVYPRTGVAMGPLAVATMADIRVHKAVLGTHGIVSDGVFNSNSLLVETERQMMRCAQEVIVAADRTKFGRLALSRLCGLDEIHAMVVDDGLAAGYRDMLGEAGVRLHPAPIGADDNLNDPETEAAATTMTTESSPPGRARAGA